jgi:hypothetical protein
LLEAEMEAAHSCTPSDDVRQQIEQIRSEVAAMQTEHLMTGPPELVRTEEWLRD